MGGVKGEEKWRWDETGAPEGWLGEGKGSHTCSGKLGNHWEGRGSKGSVARFPPPTKAPSSHVGPEGVGGREGGAKVKARPQGPAHLRGGWGKGGVPTPSRTHPWLGVQWRQGRPWGRWWGRGAKGTGPGLSLSI